ncbi:type IV pilin protein [Lysobacter koreensis]|uniref:Type IV pilin protein n=1 Tax=Lysobacter koreensis TaxID=266122 RepID=A0ABW2YNY7_9GAMM
MPGHPRRAPRAYRQRSRGLTLIELLLAVAVLGVLASLAFSAYPDYRERVRVSQARTEISGIAMQIKNYHAYNYSYPDSLNDVNLDSLDPWGNPYRYTNLIGPGNGQARKDRKLNPLNSDFDLFSTGKDGQFKTQISNKESLDDVIRANDGAFIDLASKY